MVNKDDDTQLKIELLKIVDHILEEGYWDAEDGLLFEASGKKIKDLRERIKKEIELDSLSSDDLNSTIAQRIAERSGLQEVYISLYCSHGSVIKRWEAILNAIQNLGISRPIYKDENDVCSLVRSKANQENEAYAVVYIKQEDILESTEGMPMTDRFNHELLMVRDGVITPGNVAKFIHKTGTYLYQEGKLIKQGGAVERNEGD